MNWFQDNAVWIMSIFMLGFCVFMFIAMSYASEERAKLYKQCEPVCHPYLVDECTKDYAVCSSKKKVPLTKETGEK